MRTILYIGILSLVLPLGGCLLQTRDDINQAEDKRQIREQVSSIQKVKADNEAKINDVQTELRQLSGRVETMEYASRNNQGAGKAELEQLKKTVEAQNEKIKALEQHIEATETRLLGAIQSINAPPAPPPAKEDKAKKGEKPSKKVEDSDKGGDQFNEAEALFGEKEYKRAIVKYEAYREGRTKGAKAAEATYKIGVCFDELGMKKEAKEFYQEVLEKFSGSKSAKKAKYRLNQLK